MADGISYRMITDKFDFGIRQRQQRMPRAAMWAVREAARIGRRAAQSAAPVLKDPSTLSHAKLQRYRRAGFNTAAAYNRPVPGLLRASIRSAKNVKRLGDSEVSVKFGPRGPRTHLYAGKIEAKAHYMDAGEEAAKAALPVVAQRAFDRVWGE